MAESYGTSFGQSTGTSTGDTYIPDYPQSQFLMQVAQHAQALAGKMANWGAEQYTKNQGLTDQIINEGKLFASPGRIAQDMGMAEAGVAQAGEAGRQNTLRDLESFGIDPSSGRYAALDKAERAQTAANEAGAGNLQRMKTEDIGRQLRLQGTGMSLQNEQIGGQNMRIPNDYLRTAMDLKYPPLGHNQRSQQQSNSGSGNRSISPAPNQERAARQQPSRPGGDQGAGPGYDGAMGGPRPQAGNQGGGLPPGRGGGSQAQILQIPDYGTRDKADDTRGGDYYGAQGSDYQAPNTDFNEGDDYYSPPQQDTGGNGGDYYGAEGADYGTNTGGYDEDYAAGGAVDIDGTQGGGVPTDASPSGGEQVDDVRANLNADEFIIPRDVALWKGQEFFQKLIQQSRQKRVTAPAHGTPSQQQG